MANRTYLIISTNIDIVPGIVSYIITYAGNGAIQLCIFTSISDVFQFAPFATVSSVCSVLCDDQKWFENTLQWRNNNGHDSVSNHQPHHCLLNRLFRRRSKKTSKLHVTGLCAGILRWPVNSHHKWPVTRKMFPFDDVIVKRTNYFRKCTWFHWLSLSKYS